MSRKHLPRHFRRKPFFPFWVFIILFFVFMSKSGAWAWMFPFFLIWMFRPMLWALSSGGRKWGQEQQWEREREWETPRNPIPPEWQTAPQPPARNTVLPSAHPRSTAGLPTTCPACGGPVNNTTLDWRVNTPHCGYCGTHLK